MKASTTTLAPELLSCAVCARELAEADLWEIVSSGQLLCLYCRAEAESCGCGEE